MPNLEDKLIESSKALIDILIEQIGDKQELFDEAMELVYRNDHQVSMRAAWLVGHCLRKNIQLLFSHVERMSQFLPTAKIDGIKRTFIYFMSMKEVKLTEVQMGIYADLAFQWAEDPREAIAVRASSIEFLLRVYQVYPEIKSELIALIESMIPEGSPGIKNKCTRLVQKLQKDQL